jgi:hypothetical protein
MDFYQTHETQREEDKRNLSFPFWRINHHYSLWLSTTNPSRESTKSNCLAYIQGRRKHQKVVGGGASVSRGTFRKKRASKKFSPRMLATGGGDRPVASMYSWWGVGQNFSNEERKKVSNISWSIKPRRCLLSGKWRRNLQTKNTHILLNDVLQKHAVA